MPPARKRRKIESKERTTRHLNLTWDADWSSEDESALEMMLKALRKRRKIVVVAGAGISVSAGIPDFRSSKGLFRTLKDEHKLKASGKQLFDASVYKDNSSTASFHDMVRSLSDMSAQATPTRFHRLLARLAKEERLLRLYTQNVDGLELTLPPLETQIPLNHKGPWPRTIQLHGGLEKMVCHKCKHISPFNPELFNGPVPPSCPECEERDSVRTAHAGKRSHGVGKLRPRMVLYNEQNPDEDAIGAIVAADLRARPDAVIIVGTTLKIPPVRRIVKEMCLTARGRQNGITMMINKETLTLGKDLEECFDVVVEGTSDKVAELANLKDWDDADECEGDVEECTLSDVERAKARSGHVRVVIETPKKKTKHIGGGALISDGIMTPPISIAEESLDESRDSKDAIQSQLQNPASHGRSIAEVLGQSNSNKENQRQQREQKQKKGNSTSKSIVKAVTKKRTTGTTTKPSLSSKKSHPPPSKKKAVQNQSKLTTSKITKPISSTISVDIKSLESSSSPTKNPILENTFSPSSEQQQPPLHHTSTKPPVLFPGLLSSNKNNTNRRSSTDTNSSMESSVLVDTSGLAKERQSITISPRGGKPRGMEGMID